MKKGWLCSLLDGSNGKPELYFKSIPAIHWELKHTLKDKAMAFDRLSKLNLAEHPCWVRFSPRMCRWFLLKSHSLIWELNAATGVLSPLKSDQGIKENFCSQSYGESAIVSVNEVLQSSDQNDLHGNYHTEFSHLWVFFIIISLSVITQSKVFRLSRKLTEDQLLCCLPNVWLCN